MTAIGSAMLAERRRRLDAHLRHLVVEQKHEVGNGCRVSDFAERFHGLNSRFPVFGSERCEEVADQPHIAGGSEEPFAILTLDHPQILKHHRAKLRVVGKATEAAGLKVATHNEFANQINETSSSPSCPPSFCAVHSLQKEQSDCGNQDEAPDGDEGSYRKISH